MTDNQRKWGIIAISAPIAMILAFLGAVVLIVGSTPPPCQSLNGQFALVAELNPAGAGNWQSAVQDGQYWYVYQAKDAEHQGVIHRLNSSGQELDQMVAVGADHAVSFVVDHGRVSTSFYGSIRSFVYKPNTTITRARTATSPWPGGEIAMDPTRRVVVIRNGNHYRGFGAATHKPVGVEVRTPTGARQGVGVQGTTLYVLTGPTNQPARVDSYSLATGRPLGSVDVTSAGLDGVSGNREPEGMYGSQFGVKVFTGDRRRLRVYQLGTSGGRGAGDAVNAVGIPTHPIAGYGREQLSNAAQILRAGANLRLSRRDQTIGVMTAMGESSLRVIDYGDSAGPDSRGLFQQRSNGAWGSHSDRMNPFVSATNFFKAMMKVEGRESLEPTIVAHRTQGNADPYHYTKFWDPAQQIVAALGGAQAAAFTNASAGTTSAADSTASRYNLGKVQPQTAALANTVGPKFGIKTIGGYRPPGQEQYDLNGHPAGLALDFMVYGDRATGQRLADYTQQHADELGIQYIIWYQHIWNIDRADEGWRAMADRGSPTANHQDHVHVSLKKDAAPVAAGEVSADAAGCATDTAAMTGPVSATGWTAPAAGPITTPYGWRIHPIKKTRSFHYGIDIGAPCNSPIQAANAGVVVGVTHPAAYGSLVEVDHGRGVITSYGHMYDSGVLVHVGDKVTAGQQIAKVGSAGWSTGCHLHFEVKVNGSTVDPLAYLNNVGVKLG